MVLLRKAVVETLPGLKLTIMPIPVSIKGTLKSMYVFLSLVIFKEVIARSALLVIKSFLTSV
jgi:hypothetical protein